MYRIWNNFKTTLLLSGLMGLCLAVGYLLGGPAALLPALLIGAGMNLIAFFFSDKIALATVRATEIGPRRRPGPLADRSEPCRPGRSAHAPRLSLAGRGAQRLCHGGAAPVIAPCA